jgi:hypothetical protein
MIVQFPYEAAFDAMVSVGLSKSMSTLYVEMARRLPPMPASSFRSLWRRSSVSDVGPLTRRR